MLKNLAAYIRVTKKRLFLLLYFVFYLTAFYLIEHRSVEPHYFVIHSPLDDKIPFCEFFVMNLATKYVNGAESKTITAITEFM